ncbi:MAG TPA: SRPBCC family protein [Pseudolabrys sp.]|nr:SRPBCC family protein [Pseudolabrys sp.]
MSKPSFVYVTYIATTPERLWQALVDPDITEKYWYGYRVSAGGKAGDPVIAVSPKGKEVHRDVLIESDPPHRLSYSWHPLQNGLAHEKPSRVTFTIEPLKNQVRLTIVHDDFDEGSKVYEAITSGWPAILSSLKSYLETGRGLESSWTGDDTKRWTESEAQS